MEQLNALVAAWVNGLRWAVMRHAPMEAARAVPVDWSNDWSVREWLHLKAASGNSWPASSPFGMPSNSHRAIEALTPPSTWRSAALSIRTCWCERRAKGWTRQKAFRLRLRVVDGIPQQYVHDSRDYPVHVIDLSGEPDPRAAAAEWMRTELDQPVDLLGGPLSSTAVIKVGNDLFFWYQRGHHLALDGHGGWTLASRGAEIYTALAEGRSPEDGALGPLSVLEDADRAYRASAGFEQDGQYWHDVLSDLPETDGAEAHRPCGPGTRRYGTRAMSPPRTTRP